jgi:HK97 family phage major capsid protein
MKRTSKIIRQAIGTASDELMTLIDKPAEFAAKEAEIEALEGELKRTISAEQHVARLGRPVEGDGLNQDEIIFNPAEAAQRGNTLNSVRGTRTFEDCIRIARANIGLQINASTHFRSLGEQLQAIATYSLSRGATVDNRLKRAPTGAGEVDPTGGGFLVQQDFQEAIFMLAHDMGEMLGRVGKIPISDRSNTVTINAVDETSRATGSRWGGVQSYWVGEGTQVNTTKPKFRQVKFNLHKLMALMYTTDELLQDAPALQSIASTAFSEEIMFDTEDAIFEGNGNGMPMGIMASDARIPAAKVSGQAAATILKANIDQMWSQLWVRSRKNAVWFINQEIEPQLNSLNQPISTAGGQLVYLPPGGLSSAPYATLYGRPVIATEYNNALGTEGDIMLADLSQYMLVDKGGVQAQTSMHVAFLTDEMVFRITYRVDGKPMWYKPLTPFKGSTAKSPFITLATRS